MRLALTVLVLLVLVGAPMAVAQTTDLRPMVSTLEMRTETASGPIRVVAQRGAAPAASGRTLVWAVSVTPLREGEEGPSAPDAVTLPVAVPDAAQSLPADVELEAPFPNPTTERATVPFALPVAGAVRLALFDALGREVVVLVDDVREAGHHRASLLATDLAPGVYVLRLVAGVDVLSRSVTILR